MDQAQAEKDTPVSSEVLEYYRNYSQSRQLPRYLCGEVPSTVPTENRFLTESEPHFVTVSVAPRPPLIGQDHIVTPTVIVTDVGSDNRGQLSPTSSITSNRKLEWDNGADIGYENCEVSNKSLYKSSSLPTLNTLEREIQKDFLRRSPDGKIADTSQKNIANTSVKTSDSSSGTTSKLDLKNIASTSSSSNDNKIPAQTSTTTSYTSHKITATSSNTSDSNKFHEITEKVVYLPVLTQSPPLAESTPNISEKQYSDNYYETPVLTQPRKPPRKNPILFVKPKTPKKTKSTSCDNLTNPDETFERRNKYFRKYRSKKQKDLVMTKPVSVDCYNNVVKDNISVAIQTESPKQQLVYLEHFTSDKDDSTSSDSSSKIVDCNSFEYLYGSAIDQEENQPILEDNLNLPAENVDDNVIEPPSELDKEDIVENFIASNLKRSRAKSDLTNVTTITSTESEKISSKLSNNLISDIDKSVDLLHKLLNSQRYDEETKKYYIRKIVRKIVDSKYVDDKTTTSSSTTTTIDKTTTPSDVTEPVSPLKYTKQSKSDKILKNSPLEKRQVKSDTNVPDIYPRLQRNPRFTLTNNEFCVVQNRDDNSSSDLFRPHSRQVFPSYTTDSSLEKIQDSSTSRSWKDDKTLSEQLMESRKDHGDDNDDLVTFARRERQSQLTWISNEIKHLSKLKTLLEKRDYKPRDDVKPAKSTAVYVITTDKNSKSDRQHNRLNIPNVISANRTPGHHHITVQRGSEQQDYKVREAQFEQAKTCCPCPHPRIYKTRQSSTSAVPSSSEDESCLRRCNCQRQVHWDNAKQAVVTSESEIHYQVKHVDDRSKFVSTTDSGNHYHDDTAQRHDVALSRNNYASTTDSGNHYHGSKSPTRTTKHSTEHDSASKRPISPTKTSKPPAEFDIMQTSPNTSPKSKKKATKSDSDGPHKPKHLLKSTSEPSSPKKVLPAQSASSNRYTSTISSDEVNRLSSEVGTNAKLISSEVYTSSTCPATSIRRYIFEIPIVDLHINEKAFCSKHSSTCEIGKLCPCPKEKLADKDQEKDKESKNGAGNHYNATTTKTADVDKNYIPQDKDKLAETKQDRDTNTFGIDRLSYVKKPLTQSKTTSMYIGLPKLTSLETISTKTDEYRQDTQTELDSKQIRSDDNSKTTYGGKTADSLGDKTTQIEPSGQRKLSQTDDLIHLRRDNNSQTFDSKIAESVEDKRTQVEPTQEKQLTQTDDLRHLRRDNDSQTFYSETVEDKDTQVKPIESRQLTQTDDFRNLRRDSNSQTADGMTDMGSKLKTQGSQTRSLEQYMSKLIEDAIESKSKEFSSSEDYRKTYTKADDNLKDAIKTYNKDDQNVKDTRKLLMNKEDAALRDDGRVSSSKQSSDKDSKLDYKHKISKEEFKTKTGSDQNLRQDKDRKAKEFEKESSKSRSGSSEYKSSTMSSSNTTSSSDTTIKICQCCRTRKISLDHLFTEAIHHPLCQPCFQQNETSIWKNNQPFYTNPNHICNCYTLVKTQQIQAIKNTITELNNLENANGTYCSCSLVNRLPKKGSNICVSCYCPIGKSTRIKDGGRIKHGGVTYTLKLESAAEEDVDSFDEEDKVNKEKPKERYSEEVIVKVPHKGVRGAKNGRGKEHKKEKREKDEEKENHEGKGRKSKKDKRQKKATKTLQEYLCLNRPNFIESAEQRRKCLIELAYMREERCQKYKQLLAMTQGMPVMPNQQQNQSNAMHKPRIFSTKEMKRLTAKNYKKLPEVQQRLLDNRDRQMKKANRLLSDIFNKKLRDNVLKGQPSLSTSVSVINLA